MATEGLTIEKRDDGVAIVRMDIPGEPMNTLRDDFVDTFTEVFSSVEKDPDIKAVVFTSGKKDSFIAGADITMLENVTTAEDGARISREGHKVMGRIENFPKPVVPVTPAWRVTARRPSSVSPRHSSVCSPVPAARNGFRDSSAFSPRSI